MKKLFVVLMVLFFVTPAFADHIKGGFFTYTYLGTSNGKLQYRVVLNVYMDVGNLTSPVGTNQQVNPTIPITVFDAASNTQVQNVTATLGTRYHLSRNFNDPCIVGEPLGAYYTIVPYELPVLEVAPNAAGYILAYQRCCRINGIENVQAPSFDYGNTFTISIPGSSAGITAPTNSSPNFLINDTAVVCTNSFFQLPFVATDPNGDSLSYYFCAALNGGSRGNGNQAPDPAAPPPYASIAYAPGYSGGSPLGSAVTINPVTGLISGIAPSITGDYVVSVCIDEFRSGVLIARTRKELHVEVGDCNAVQATLQPQYVNCQDFNVLFSNATPDGAESHFWDFGVPGVTNDTSNLLAPSFSYPDTGTYTLTLIVNRNGACTDTSTSLVKVYPGFFPGFTSAGICATKPTQFTDTTRTRYGIVNSWSWDFGDAATLADTSRLRNPSYTYPVNGTKNVRFIVTSDKGCIDTVLKAIQILDKPPLSVPFKDTLICNGDTLELNAIGNGSFSWTPNTAMLNPNTANPLVFPTVTTTYTVQLNDQGCLNTESVQVRVVDFVTLRAVDDKGICLTDSVQLGATTNGLRFEWTPASHFSNPNILAPFATPTGPVNQYVIRAHIGHCSTTDTVIVRTSPYPAAAAGPDTTICFGTPALLQGTITGTSFAWSPTNSLTNANTLTPTARPSDSTLYILTVFDASGFCGNPKKDSILVRVVPRIRAFASRDTSVVIGQPLQLTSGGTRATGFSWSPATGLNNPAIFNPIATFNGTFDTIRYKVLVNTVEGCVDSAFVKIRIYKTIPSIFVPTAFTPDGDGRNDAARPIAVGIKKIEYFRIYNRWGELVFQTSENGKGWNGKIGNKDQGTNVFVWVVKAEDYLGKPYFGKGTLTLIR